LKWSGYPSDGGNGEYAIGGRGGIRKAAIAPPSFRTGMPWRACDETAFIPSAAAHGLQTASPGFRKVLVWLGLGNPLSAGFQFELVFV
jgi:hypothetical protein